MIEKRETIEHLAQHADKFAEARLAGTAGLGSWYYFTAEDFVLYLTILYLILQVIVISPRAIPIIKMWVGRSKRRRAND